MQYHPDFITHNNVTSGCLLVLLCRTSSAGKRHPVASVSQDLKVRTNVPCPCAAKGGTWGSHTDLPDLHIFEAPNRP